MWHHWRQVIRSHYLFTCAEVLPKTCEETLMGKVAGVSLQVCVATSTEAFCSSKMCMNSLFKTGKHHLKRKNQVKMHRKISWGTDRYTRYTQYCSILTEKTHTHTQNLQSKTEKKKYLKKTELRSAVSHTCSWLSRKVCVCVCVHVWCEWKGGFSSS